MNKVEILGSMSLLRRAEEAKLGKEKEKQL